MLQVTTYIIMSFDLHFSLRQTGLQFLILDFRRVLNIVNFL